MSDLEKTNLTDVVKTEYLSPKNAVFKAEKGFISLEYTAADGEKKTYSRVFLHRCFPNEITDGYISVLDSENNEAGIIKSLNDFPEDVKALLETELKRRYFVFTIKKIRSVKEKYGYSYWTVDEEKGEREFTVQDTYRSINKITDDRIVVTDIDGNRYEIPSLSALDRKSQKRIEIFL